MTGGTEAAQFRIGLLGPSRVGKTSLVTALLAEAQNLLAGSGVAMRPADRATEDKVVRNRQDLEGDILAGEFSSVGLKGNTEPFTFRLNLDPGVPGAEINIELLDFPGGWLEAGNRPAQSEADWERCRDFITHSTILLIPVDAAVLMEASEARHRKLMSRLLTTVAVESVARDWAIERSRRPDEPALLAFCPVKCESYFTDNGGYRNRSADLSKRFHEAYAGVLKAVRDETSLAARLYAPVDTIGCVEMVDAKWGSVQTATDELFTASYRIREPRRISRAGVDDLMRAICKQLVEGRRIADAAEGQELSARAVQATDYASQDEGFLRNMWLWVSRERKARHDAAREARSEAEEVERRVAALDGVLKQIAGSRFGPRVEIL